MKKINIAVDGLSSCGKSTLAKDLAKKSGTRISIWGNDRAVALYALRTGWVTETTSTKKH